MDAIADCNKRLNRGGFFFRPEPEFNLCRIGRDNGAGHNPAILPDSYSVVDRDVWPDMGTSANYHIIKNGAEGVNSNGRMNVGFFTDKGEGVGRIRFLW